MPSHVPASVGQLQGVSPESNTPLPQLAKLEQVAVHLPAPAQTSVVFASLSSQSELLLHVGVHEMFEHPAEAVPGLLHESIVNGLPSSQSELLLHSAENSSRFWHLEEQVPAPKQVSTVSATPSSQSLLL